VTRLAEAIESNIRSMRLPSAILLLVLGWFVCCIPWFVQDSTVPWDSKDEFYPTLYFISQSIRAGDAPFWNPYNFSGHPTVSDPQSLLFSPLAVGLMSLVDRPSIYWFDGVEFVHLLFGGLGMLLLTIHLGRTPIAGLLAAGVFMFGGPAAARLQHVPIILAYSYFPFALLTLDLALKSKRVAWGLVFGVIAGVMAGHQVQVAYLFCLVLAGFILHEAVSSNSFLRFFADRSRLFFAAFIAGIISLAIPLFATLQFLPFSTRQGFSFDEAVADSMHPLAAVTLFVHDFFGNAHGAGYWGPGDITETFLYGGALPITLFVFFGIATGAVFERQFRYFFGVGVFGLFFAFGKFTPFYWLIYKAMPGLSLFRRTPDGAFLVNIVLALGTSFLFDRLCRGPVPKFRRWLVVAVLMGTSLLLGWGLSFAADAGKLSRQGKEYGIAMVFLAGSFWLLHAVAKSRSAMRSSALAFLALLLLATDLRVHNVGTEFNSYTRDGAHRFIANFSEDSGFARQLKDGLKPDEIGPYRAEVTAAEAFWANGSILVGVHATQGYNPLRYELYDQATGARAFYATPRPFTPLMPSYNSPLFNLLSVKYVASLATLRQLDPNVDESHFKLLFDQGLKIWENESVFPRVLTATAVHIDSNPERAIVEKGMPALDYRSVAVLTHLPKTLQSLQADTNVTMPLPGKGDAAARITAYRNSEVVVSASSSRDIIIVLNDIYYPYWRVYVDGQEQELLQTNYIFRGVHVGPGTHEIVFRFEPFSWTAIKGTLTRLVR